MPVILEDQTLPAHLKMHRAFVKATVLKQQPNPLRCKERLRPKFEGEAGGADLKCTRIQEESAARAVGVI